jgi:hypothetical protein
MLDINKVRFREGENSLGAGRTGFWKVRCGNIEICGRIILEITEEARSFARSSNEHPLKVIAKWY